MEFALWLYYWVQLMQGATGAEEEPSDAVLWQHGGALLSKSMKAILRLEWISGTAVWTQYLPLCSALSELQKVINMSIKLESVLLHWIQVIQSWGDYY